MKRRAHLFAALVIACCAAAQAETIQYEGSSTIGKFIADAGIFYPAADLTSNVETESRGGEECAVDNTCELGGVARQLTADALNQGVTGTLIGKDAIAAIVNWRNPVNDISRSQLKGIFSGRITNWSELGGPDMAIKPYIVQTASATRQVFKEKILGANDYGNVEVARPDRRILSKVVHEWGAIGQISIAFLQDINAIRALKIDGQSPTADNPDYPVTRPLYLVTHGKPSAKLQSFLDWTLSDEGQKVVKRRFVGVR